MRSSEDKLFMTMFLFNFRCWLVDGNCYIYMTKMNTVSALMQFMWSGYAVAAWVMYGLVQAGSSMAEIWDASLMTVVIQGWLLIYKEDEQHFYLAAFHVAGLDVSCCMGNAWVGPNRFFFGRYMSCKFNVSCELTSRMAVKLVQAGMKVMKLVQAGM